MSDSLTAPSLSTYQDDQTFEFERYSEVEHKRNHLRPNWQDDNDLNTELGEYYSIADIVAHLSQRDDNGSLLYKKITLQFPDSLVADSAIVVQQLQDGLSKQNKNNQSIKSSESINKQNDHESCTHQCKTCQCSDDKAQNVTNNENQQVWILADTAYSSCCIDEVAAGHVSSDIVIHFGDACLNAIQKLPAVYVFGNPYVDTDDVIEQFKKTYTDLESKVVLMADAPNTRHLPLLYEQLKEIYPNVSFADLNLEESNDAKILGFQSSNLNTRASSIRFSNRILISQNEIDEDELIDYSLFHITMPQPPHLMYLSTKFTSISIYDPSSQKIDQGPFPSLMKRYRYMHIARTAGTIGILVNTLSLKNTRELIRKVSAKIKEADKKSYMFVVGKPNVAKLANFESIDVWCVLGCGQGGIIIDNTSEFYKPIITPYELELALNPMVQWSGKWETDFANFLKSEEDEEVEEEMTGASTASNCASDDDGEDEAPEFNVVTGKYVSSSRPLRNIQHLEIDSVSQESKDEGQLVKAFSQAVSIKGTISTSATYLQNRQWTGLGSDFNADEDYDADGAIVEEGGAGIARGYDFDVEDKKKVRS